MRRKDTALSFRLDSGLKERLAEMADADHRPLSHYITLILAQHVERTGRKGK